MKRCKRFVALCLMTLMVALTCVLIPSTSLEVQAAGMSDSQAMEWGFQVLDLVNKERAANGLSALVMDGGLMDSAKVRASEITQYFSHTRPNGESCFTAWPDSQHGKYYLGENIAAGQTSPQAVVNAWMNSPGHRANILNANFTGLGAYVVKTDDGYGYYWVQCFGGVEDPIMRGGAPAKSVTTNDGSIPMYRLYNPNSGEHFYTANYFECVNVCAQGWNYEGVAWYAPASGEPVYRLYNANAGDHHYTKNAFEKDMLVLAGWSYEGVCWYSGGSVPLHRAYNPNAKAGSHHYTTNYGEIQFICARGWNYENVAWYGIR